MMPGQLLSVNRSSFPAETRGSSSLLLLIPRQFGVFDAALN
jgi:hypothetical protein